MAQVAEFTIITGIDATFYDLTIEWDVILALRFDSINRTSSHDY